MVGIAAIAVGKVAHAQGKSMLVWAIIGLIICSACALLIPIPLISIGIGFAISVALAGLIKVF